MQNRNKRWQDRDVMQTSMMGAGFGTAVGLGVGIVGKLFFGFGATRGGLSHVARCMVAGNVVGMGMAYTSAAGVGFFAERMVRNKLSENIKWQEEKHEQSVHKRK